MVDKFTCDDCARKFYNRYRFLIHAIEHIRTSRRMEFLTITDGVKTKILRKKSIDDFKIEGIRMLELSGNHIIMLADDILVDSDDALQYCAQKEHTILFTEKPTTSADVIQECPKRWPLTYVLPPLNEHLIIQIDSIESIEEGNALKNNIAFCSSLLNPIVDDMMVYLDEDKNSLFDPNFVVALIEMDTKSGKKSARLQELTMNDAKVIGSHTMRKRQKTAPDSKFPSASFKNLNSCWTPVVNRASNEQIFLERCELVSHWFDMWTDSQRKRFFKMLLHKSAGTQLHFVRDWFEVRVPLQRVDFTKVLPRFLSLYIFSFLDPRSLSRASMVNWHWKFLTEQDCLWTPKCQKYGWFLPYSPSENEYGAWKRHYVACTMTLDMVLPTKEGNEMYGTRGDGSQSEKKLKAKRESALKLTSEQSKAIRDAREPFVVSEAYPHDVERNTRAFFMGLNPNDPDEPKSARLLHNRFGRVDKAKTSLLLPSASFGVDLTTRRSSHHLRAEQKEAERQLSKTGLSKSMDMIKFEEERYNGIIDMAWEPPHKSVVSARANLSGGGAKYPLPWSKVAAPIDVAKMSGLMAGFPGYTHPRVVFISSRVPAHEMLVDAVMFGVLPIIYEFEGTSLETLLFQLDLLLRGRIAQSIGVFGHKESNGELRLVHGRTLDLASLDSPAIRAFLERLAEQTVPAADGGHIDLFSPLAADAQGTELLIQLEILTNMKFCAPTGLLGNYNHVNSEWSLSPEGVHPPSLYFEENKLAVWASAADLVLESILVTRASVASYLDRVRVDLSRQITGQIVFDALGQTDVVGVRKIADVVLEGILGLSSSSGVDPLEVLGFHLLEKSELGVPGELSTLRRSARHEDDSDVEEDIEEDIDSDRSEGKKASSREKAVRDEGDVEKSRDLGQTARPIPGVLQSRRMQLTGETGSRGPMQLTPEILAEHPEKRTPIAQEILASEVTYLRSLEIVRDWYMTPLRRAIQSNKAILAAHLIQTLFGDVMVLLEMSRKLVADLRGRLKQWSSTQCVGDVLLKFSGNLKAYTNFLSNYPIILKTLQRSIETLPKFRAFLARHDLQPESRMLSLPDFYLLPPRRIADLCTLLAWFEAHTPQNHPDRHDLQLALQIFGRLNKQISEHKERAERDRDILRIQSLIIACPQLLEGNRYFVLHEDVALLRPPVSDKIEPEFRIYQHVEDCGLFLFNDALLFTRRTTKCFPFERIRQNSHRFQISVDLHRLSIQDIADSRYVRNALQLKTSKRTWFVSFASTVGKQRFVSTVSSTILSAIDNMG